MASGCGSRPVSRSLVVREGKSLPIEDLRKPRRAEESSRAAIQCSLHTVAWWLMRDAPPTRMNVGFRRQAGAM